MIIIGINASHNATAALIKDGKILACISEERLTGVKNQYGIPLKAYEEILGITGVKKEEIDKLVFGYTDPKVNTLFATLLAKDMVISSLFPMLFKLKEEMLTRVPSSRYFYDSITSFFYRTFVDGNRKEQLLDTVENKLGVSREKVILIDHHLAHAMSAYWSNPDYSKKDWLVLTLDAMGDGLCSTVNVVKNGKFKKLTETKAGNSIGDLYGLVTSYFGMKGGEHEYKVMGLAPYANPAHAERVYQKLKKLISINPDMTFSSRIHSSLFYKILPKILYMERFDNIAFALQRLTEEILTDWVKLCVKKTGIKNVAVAGGLFMNVKANQKILESSEVENLFIMPSCGDESTAIGAAYWGYQDARNKNQKLPHIEPLGNLYLGQVFSEKEITRELTKRQYKKYKVKKVKNIETTIAKLLKDGKVVARFAGHMEWGARALGNRSIMANPSNLDAIRMINDQIKSRDFWMPFAPSIMKERAKKYLVIRKKMEAPYMIITFDSTPLGREKFKAAMHQYDFSLRPQLVDKKWNPGYYRVLSEFEKITGIGGVLNTSFNLHGFPIVCSPADAMFVFSNSGLEYLAMENYLISKS